MWRTIDLAFQSFYFEISLDHRMWRCSHSTKSSFSCLLLTGADVPRLEEFG
jgi:hypothetical protein